MTLPGKLSISFCFLLLAAGASRGQQGSSASSPPLEVLKLKWEKSVRLPRNFDPSVIPTGGTFSDPGSRVSSATPGTAATGAGTGTPAARTAGSNSSTFPATPGRLPVFYVYSIKIRNMGDKQIHGIAWDYLFLDPNSGAELGRHQFISYVKAAVAETVTLKGQMRTPPVRIVQAPNSDGPKLRPLERAAIQCVLFADNTIWRNPFGRKGTCEFLKNIDAMKQKHSTGQQ